MILTLEMGLKPLIMLVLAKLRQNTDFGGYLQNCNPWFADFASWSKPYCQLATRQSTSFPKVEVLN